MKFLSYVLRNARRSPIRSLLTIGSTAMCLFLMMMLLSFISSFEAAGTSLREYNRLIVMSSQGFAQPVPVSRLNELKAMDGVTAVTAFSWYGGKYKNEVMPFAQFAVTADTIFDIYDELTIPPGQLADFEAERSACVIGRKLAEERKIKVGDPLPLQADTYPFDMDLVVKGIYDGPSNRDLRMCMFHWEYMNEGLKKVAPTSRMIDNAGIAVLKCKSAGIMPELAKKIDAAYVNSDTPTRSQSEEAFNQMFLGMFGDLKGLISNIGLAVVFSLIFVAGNAMAMALRERTTEVAVLKAIGFRRGLVVNLVLAESIIVTMIGGAIGALGAKAFFDVVDISRYTAGRLPFFFIPWPTALLGLAAALGIGFVSGIIPAINAARLSVVNGLRKVV
jgi:putative ABC transport system permease protein